MDDLISRKADGYNISHQAVLIIKGGGQEGKVLLLWSRKILGKSSGPKAK